MQIIKPLGEKKAQALAADPVLFVTAFDREPWPYQADILRAVEERDERDKFRRRLSVISMPRQNGKSTLSGWLGLHLLFTRENQQIVTVALDADQARIIFRDARTIINRSGILGDQVKRFTYNEIELRNDNHWLVKSAESVSSRGLRPSRFV
jgi:phage terminase large subunit-like protein